MSEAGVHRPHVGGIHGRSNDGAYSLVLAGGFEDEVVCHSCKQWTCRSNASNVSMSVNIELYLVFNLKLVFRQIRLWKKIAATDKLSSS